jgi:hypothetical protein
VVVTIIDTVSGVKAYYCNYDCYDVVLVPVFVTKIVTCTANALRL